MNNTALILESLHVLVAENVIGEKQYTSRYKGFIGELAFSEWLNNKPHERKIYSGGYFVPVENGNSSLENPIYFTVTRLNPDEYIPIYTAISKIGCNRLYFIQWLDETSINNWQLEDVMGTNVQLPKPQLITYLFDSSSNSFQQVSLQNMLSLYTDRPRRKTKYLIPNTLKADFIKKLSEFDVNYLLDLYVQRLIFDGYIGFGKVHGIASDIDLIIQAKNKTDLVFLEIKEKDLSKTPPVGFGMDVARIVALESISLKTGVDFHYVVREINNQKNREFVNWRYIEIKKFKEMLGSSIFQGGSGMGFENGEYPTQICPQEHFLIM